MKQPPITIPPRRPRLEDLAEPHPADPVIAVLTELSGAVREVSREVRTMSEAVTKMADATNTMAGQLNGQSRAMQDLAVEVRELMAFRGKAILKEAIEEERRASNGRDAE